MSAVFCDIFLATFALRFLGKKLPKPLKSTFSRFATVFLMIWSSVSTVSRTSDLLIPVCLAISVIISLLITLLSVQMMNNLYLLN